MDIKRASDFNFYSIGVVTVDKLRNTTYIKVTPIENLSDVNGPLNNQTQTITSNSKDASNVSKQAMVKTDVTIYAKWLPLSNSNRTTAPDVIKNETVMIYRYADSDDYYWTTMFDENNIRRLETVRYSYGNDPNPLVPYTGDTSYWLEVSTHDQIITLHTSNNNGESAKYDIIINTKKGMISIEDNLNNSYYLDSVNRKFTVNTGTGELNFDVEATVNTPKITVNTQAAIINSNSTTVNCPTNTVNGDLDVNGVLKVSGDITAPRLIGKADSAATADCC